MLMLAVLLVALCAGFTALFLGEVSPGRRAELVRRLSELGESSLRPEVVRGRAREARARRLTGFFETLGGRAAAGRKDLTRLALWLLQAGYPEEHAVSLYLGLRVGLPIAVAIACLAISPTLGVTPVAILWLSALGYVGPAVVVGRRRGARLKEMNRALPDALDLLVVSVEAGLGLNQALVRVSEEIQRISPVLSEQLGLVNLEIRAGTAREEALRRLGDRTGLDDIRSLTGMLIQTDRFGTSVAQALRVQADTLRTRRRQRAEEAAAKTTIKLVFPLVLLIFPAMFVVILGPALIQVLKALGQFKG